MFIIITFHIFSTPKKLRINSLLTPYILPASKKVFQLHGKQNLSTPFILILRTLNPEKVFSYPQNLYKSKIIPIFVFAFNSEKYQIIYYSLNYKTL